MSNQGDTAALSEAIGYLEGCAKVITRRRARQSNAIRPIYAREIVDKLKQVRARLRHQAFAARKGDR